MVFLKLFLICTFKDPNLAESLEEYMHFISQDFYTKNTQKCDKKENFKQNTLGLEQQIYTSLEYFTHPLFAMFMTLKRSDMNKKETLWCFIGEELWQERVCKIESFLKPYCDSSLSKN